jgi:hypothetical protein
MIEAVFFVAIVLFVALLGGNASPRGICNCHTRTATHLVFCTLDYEHEGEHRNGDVTWAAPWPPAK